MALEKSINYLNNLAQWLEQEGVSFGDTSKGGHYTALSRGLLKEKNVIQKWLDETTAKRGSAIQLTPEDVDDLPEELLAELSRSDAEQFELDILRLIEEAGGMISLDVLLVRWYHKKGEIVKRKNMTARIYRMLSKERLFSTPGYKGVYQLQRPEESPEEIDVDDYDMRDELDDLDAEDDAEYKEALANT